MTTEQIEEFRRLESEATPLIPPEPLTVEYENDTGPGDEGFWEWWRVQGARFDTEADAHLYCFLRNHAPALLGRLTELERLREPLKNIIEGYDGMLHACDDPEDGCAEVWQEYIQAGRAALAKLTPTTGETKCN